MIDTRAKRESATKLLVPSYVQTICPTGTLDRPGVLWLYNGLGAGVAVVSVVHALTWTVDSSKIVTAALQSTGTLARSLQSTKTLTFEVQ
jgi:hypothetical protein